LAGIRVAVQRIWYDILVGVLLLCSVQGSPQVSAE
jgi:hypothetical protein